eukprot:264316-Amphidinium_carterae.1
MFLHQPRKKLWTGWATLHSNVKDGKHPSMEEKAGRVRRRRIAIFSAFGTFLSQVDLEHRARGSSGGLGRQHTLEGLSNPIESFMMASVVCVGRSPGLIPDRVVPAHESAQRRVSGPACKMSTSSAVGWV